MPEYTFKTLYFPANCTRSGSPAKVTISLPRTPNGASITQTFVEYIHSLSGSAIRAALGNPVLEDLEQAAESEGRSLSNACVYRLLGAFIRNGGDGKKTNVGTQRVLPFFEVKPEERNEAVAEEGGFGVTFRES